MAIFATALIVEITAHVFVLLVGFAVRVLLRRFRRSS